MTPLATVLYEDKMQSGVGGQYPLHDLVMRMVEDEINGETWRLHPLVDKNPRKGVGNILKDVKERTSLLARAGGLYVLVDRDVIATHLGLPNGAPDANVIAAFKRRSDAPDKLHPFLLYPNLEGMLRSIGDCAPSLLPASVKEALRKDLNERDIVLNELKKAIHRDVRDCVRRRQAGLDALVKSIAAMLPKEAIGKQGGLDPDPPTEPTY
jgi:hypothetical protein